MKCRKKTSELPKYSTELFMYKNHETHFPDSLFKVRLAFHINVPVIFLFPLWHGLPDALGGLAVA